jgi:hypothetical protein
LYNDVVCSSAITDLCPMENPSDVPSFEFIFQCFLDHTQDLEVACETLLQTWLGSISLMCSTEMTSVCSDQLTDKVSMIVCLADHEDELSIECRSQIEEFAGMCVQNADQCSAYRYI